ncbi:RNI-like protein [Tothia fuscella]|uniref:RNI-like protein n=1 Tax=Tothia fuscella TaxID=1048955 RepID=A0A9P4NKD2_9PEZI|nr:RNI-like protein [Tothia fuscella]
MPRTLSSTEYKELGKRYYGQKKYKDALDAFTEAIEANPSPDITLFDYRAATWEKLEDPQAALADSRRMIKAAKQDPRGYLRTAQILQNLKQFDVALNIYQYGLRNVPVSANPHVKLLQRAHNKLNMQLSPPTAVDPFSQLPLEIVEMIIGYLKFHQIVTCLRVSKQWRGLITSAPSLWGNLDLLRNNKQSYAKSSFIRSCIKYSQYKIHTARLHRFSDRSGLRNLATMCKGLAHLELLQTDFGGDSIIETVMMARNLKVLKTSMAVELSLDQISQILKHRPTLAHLEVENVKPPTVVATWKVDLPGLQVLNLSSPKDLKSRDTMRYLDFPSLVTRAPKLKELRLSRFPASMGVTLLPLIDMLTLANLEVVEFRACDLHVAPLLPPSIREFVLLDNGSSIRGLRFTNDLPALEKLHLSGLCFDIPEICGLLDGIHDMEYVGEYPKLKSFALTGVDTGIWTDGRNQQIQLLEHTRLSAIEELILTLNTDHVVDDIIAEVIAKTFKKLRRLDLSTTWVTGVGIRLIVSALKGQLRWLDVSGCRHLSADAVEWARDQGVEVVYRGELSMTAKDSRRVRYGE